MGECRIYGGSWRDMPRWSREQTDSLSPLAQRLLKQVSKEADNGDRILLANRPRKTGHGDYVWRMLAFFLSPLPIHHHLPMNAPFYAGTAEDGTLLNHDVWTQLQKALDVIVDEIMAVIPKKDWHGVQRWQGLL